MSDLYGVWANIIARCSHPNNPSYRNYGGKGIKVCERWQTYENFAKDMGKRPSKDHSLIRKKKGQDYSPENCEWARREDYSKQITYMGETHSISEWAVKLGIKERTLRHRISVGWELDQVMQRPVNRKITEAHYLVRVKTKTKDQIVLNERSFDVCWIYITKCIKICRDKGIVATIGIEDLETKKKVLEIKVYAKVEEELPSTDEVDQEGNEAAN